MFTLRIKKKKCHFQMPLCLKEKTQTNMIYFSRLLLLNLVQVICTHGAKVWSNTGLWTTLKFQNMCWFVFVVIYWCSELSLVITCFFGFICTVQSDLTRLDPLCCSPVCSRSWEILAEYSFQANLVLPESIWILM